jgi:hypothetical protein
MFPMFFCRQIAGRTVAFRLEGVSIYVEREQAAIEKGHFSILRNMTSKNKAAGLPT